MSEAQDSNTKIIYIRLLDEGTSVFRPVDAVMVSPDVFQILKSNDYDVEDEKWEFIPGTTVQCQEEVRDGESVLVAIRELNQ